VSPAVVVPSILALKKRGYGVVQGVSTLLIAASSIDDVLAISLYTIFLGLAIPHAPIVEKEHQNITDTAHTSGNKRINLIIAMVNYFIFDS